MIIDQARKRAISNLGWVDRGSLWVYDVGADPISVRLSDADHLVLRDGANDHFAAMHHFKGEQLRIAVHTSRDPELEVASCELRKDQRHAFSGDVEAFAQVPRFYTAYLTAEVAPENGYYLIRLTPEGIADFQRLDWFNSESYDLGYQSVLGAVEIPGTSTVLISIQRDSNPVIYDFVSKEIVQRIRLADRGGNPELEFHGNNEMWACDYDTLVRLNAEAWVASGQLQLQPATADGVRQFIGHYDIDGAQCAVARPFSGDIVFVNTERFEVSHQTVTGGEPLEVAMLDSNRIIARDWKTGALLTPQERTRS